MARKVGSWISKPDSKSSEYGVAFPWTGFLWAGLPNSQHMFNEPDVWAANRTSDACLWARPTDVTRNWRLMPSECGLSDPADPDPATNTERGIISAYLIADPTLFTSLERNGNKLREAKRDRTLLFARRDYVKSNNYPRSLMKTLYCMIGLNIQPQG